MKDIFGRDVQDMDVVSFPFVKQGSYINSRKEVWLSYGVVKGNRVYLLDQAGKLIYKMPGSMILLLNIAELPQKAMDNIMKIRELINDKNK